LFEGLPPAPQVIPPTRAPTRRKRYWSAEEDKFIRRQYEDGLTIAEISRQLASNWWAIKKRVEQLELPTSQKMMLSLDSKIPNCKSGNCHQV
jgi:hypothetical protein